MSWKKPDFSNVFGSESVAMEDQTGRSRFNVPGSKFQLLLDLEH
jgi:hypothetical protein